MVERSDFQTFSEKILVILMENGPLLHNQIKEVADKIEKIHRNSSRTFYKAYNLLLSKDFIEKIQIDRNYIQPESQQVLRQSYKGYQITTKGLAFLKIMQEKKNNQQ